MLLLIGIMVGATMSAVKQYPSFWIMGYFDDRDISIVRSKFQTNIDGSIT
jgi:hypothetical protein